MGGGGGGCGGSGGSRAVAVVSGEWFSLDGKFMGIFLTRYRFRSSNRMGG
jgi:hypothetical protein